MKRRTVRALFFGFGGLLLLLAAAWVVAVFYFDTIVTGILEKKLIAGVHERSHGAFDLSFASFRFRKGTVSCTGFALSRAGYRTTAGQTPAGIGLWRVSIDSVRLEGVSWVELLLSRPIHLSNLVTSPPQVYLCNLAETKNVFRYLGPDTTNPSSNDISISLINASLPAIRFYQCSSHASRGAGTVWLMLGGCRYNPDSHRSGLPFTLEHLDLSAPYLDYSDSSCSIRAEQCFARSEDSSISIGAIKLRTSSTFEVRGIHASGMNFARAMQGSELSMRELSGNAWNMLYTSPKSQKNSLSSLPFPISIKRIELRNGMIQSTNASTDCEHLTIRAMAMRADTDYHLSSRAMNASASTIQFHEKDWHFSATELHANATHLRIDSIISGSFRGSASKLSFQKKDWDLAATAFQASGDTMRIDSELSGSIAGVASEISFHRKNVAVLCRGIQTQLKGFSFGSGLRDWEASARNARLHAQNASVAFQSIAASERDSSLIIASIIYRPRPSDRSFVKGIRATGIDYRKLSSNSIGDIRSLSARAWNVDYELSSGSTGNGKSLSEQQDALARSMSFPISIRHISFPNGTVHLGAGTSVLAASGMNVEASQFSIDPKQAGNPPLFSRDVRARAASVLYTTQNSSDTISAQNIEGSTGDGTMSSDTLECSVMGKKGPMVRTWFRLGAPECSGIAFDSLWNSKSISVRSVTSRAWSIYRIDNTPEAEEEHPDPRSTDSDVSSGSQFPFPVSIGRLLLPSGRMHFIERDTATLTTSNDMSVDATGLRLRPSTAHPAPIFSAHQLISSFTSFRYSSPGSYYALHIHRFYGNLQDSLARMDSLGYIPNYSEAEWTRVHKYSVGRAHFFLSNVKLTGIDCGPDLGNHLYIKSFEAPTWQLRYYKDSRPPSDPHPDTVWLPNDFIRTTTIPFTIDRIALDSGDIQIRMRSNPDTTLASMQFDRASMTASPLSTDPNDPASREPTSIDAKGIYLGVSPVEIKAIYPLHDSGFDFSSQATVGPFDAKLLNDFLIHEDQKKITSGSFENGEIKVSVTNGTGTTTVIPTYQDLHIKILSAKPGKRPNIKDDAETFVANEFIVHRKNPRSATTEPVSATISETRKYSDEFFGFLWDMIERALGKVIGGFQ